MTPSSESQSVVHGRTMWIVALAAIGAVVLIAGLAVAAFFASDMLRGPQLDSNPAVVNPPIVAPAPTAIEPSLFEPPSEWDDEVG